MDTVANAPSVPDLTAASDSGSSSTDNITKITTPTFTGTAEAGALVTLLEGAIYGKPLISSEIGTGSSYVNIDRLTGLVIPPNDPEALREAMNLLARDDKLAEEMGRRARERFEELFTADRMAHSYVSLYEKVIGVKDSASEAPSERVISHQLVGS